MRSACVGLAIVLMFATAVSARAESVSCRIDVSSQRGGRLEVTTWDYDSERLKFMRENPTVEMIPAPVTITWYPPASGTSIELGIVYGRGDLTRLGAATEVTAGFAPIDEIKSDQYSATVTSDEAHVWRFAQAQSDLMTDQMWVTLAEASPDAFTNAVSSQDRVSIAALSQNKQLTVAVTGSNRPGMSVKFDTSATKDRDQLVAYALHLVETNDRRVCREKD